MKRNKKIDESIFFICPYCKVGLLDKRNIKIVEEAIKRGVGTHKIKIEKNIKNTFMEIQCWACFKKFSCLTGIVNRKEGSLAKPILFGEHYFIIRLKTDKGEEVVSFNTNNFFEANLKDRVSFLVVKTGLLFKKYKLKVIVNWNLKRSFKV